MADGSGNSLLDYVRNGINNAIASSPLNPLKPATQALASANAKMSARDQLAKLQKDGSPNQFDKSDWEAKMAALKKQIDAGQ